MKRFLPYILLLINALSFTQLSAQAPKRYNSAEIQLMLNKLNVVGTVLYIAAHPDDENTRFIAYLSKEKLVNTGYLSITRGDGGQNLIGPEIREQLGVIRTQELLEARKIDGGKQFFTRANDFGFSKTPEETYNIWDKEQVLADMVWVIRKFRPDVLVTRFAPDYFKTHGHHSASAQLAVEAFSAAADTKRFPEQLQYVQVWQAKRIVWNTSYWFFGSEKDFKDDGLYKYDVGAYNELLGKSITEIAAEARSMHRSQGFGTALVRGETFEYLKHLKGDSAKTNDILEGVDLTWKRIPGSQKVAKLLAKAAKDFNPENPSAIVPTLIKAKDELWKIHVNAGHYGDAKSQEIDEIIKACLGLYIEAISSDYSLTHGQNFTINYELVNRSILKVDEILIRLKNVSWFTGKDTIIYKTLEPNITQNYKVSYVVDTLRKKSSEVATSNPYWLREKGTEGMFKVGELSYRGGDREIGYPENLPWNVEVDLNISGSRFVYYIPIVYKRIDPAFGEKYRPVTYGPPAFVNLKQDVFMFADTSSKLVNLTVRANKDKINGTLKLNADAKDWQIIPATQPFTLNTKGEEQTFTFRIKPLQKEVNSTFTAAVVVDGQEYTKSQVVIDYPHIATQTLYPEASGKLVKLDIKTKGKNIGYIMGSGDEIPQSLEQIRYKVTLLKDDDITAEN
ncbi:MAG: PIG-L family deacetylase, partial [Bacteroidia bacterium]